MQSKCALFDYFLILRYMWLTQLETVLLAICICKIPFSIINHTSKYHSAQAYESTSNFLNYQWPSLPEIFICLDSEIG